MAQSEARAWWADVQHLREEIERERPLRERVAHAAEASNGATAPAEASNHATATPAVDGDLAAADDLAARRAARERRRAETGLVAPAEPAPRRTIEIRGQAVPAPSVPRLVEVDRRRPPRRPAERACHRPDRVAAWALVMALVLILLAVGTADASVAAAL